MAGIPDTTLEGTIKRLFYKTMQSSVFRGNIFVFVDGLAIDGAARKAVDHMTQWHLS